MKKLKKWVVDVIILIQIILFMLLGAEVDNFKMFVISKIICVVLLLINHLILTKYSNIYE